MSFKELISHYHPNHFTLKIFPFEVTSRDCNMFIRNTVKVGKLLHQNKEIVTFSVGEVKFGKSSPKFIVHLCNEIITNFDDFFKKP